ncbi:MAG: SDR family NAD(P)-dependent oxidoreductase [Gammaproteobacteria bacterium]|jgi:NAD(P)-dependent dehydrogenase (short-subunit alcohol dehydrogenase family)
MKEVKGKVAFITGGASGVGLGMAEVFSRAGMKVAIADIRQDHLDEAVAYLKGKDISVHPVNVDVTDREGMARAAQETVQVFGKVHLLCNNAGINLFKTVDESTYEDWDWVTGINLDGVFNGIKSFLPHIEAHGEGGHIVNTASMASFVAGATAGIYTATKFAVRGMSESLRLSLADRRIGVSILCPGLVKSRIYESEQIRPANLTRPDHEVDEEWVERLEQVHEMGMDPVEVGEKTLRGIRNNDFYILSHPDHKEEVEILCEELINAFPDEEPEPQRFEFEKMRRQLVWDTKEKIKKMDL